ncbi:MAG: hypothetical protein LHW45_02680 [Candidatus Cloacimonetes bacterium]|jgi:hypothetical protein|nr:hypothetical protein [Candidatus Cloacimonadota bacterium]MDY0366523.1 hypothetical protein [Candidatus Syntrophosphaera sp.]HOY83666.1 hypothetical protein [Candidatus Syntrophosphaera sp.]
MVKTAQFHYLKRISKHLKCRKEFSQVHFSAAQPTPLFRPDRSSLRLALALCRNKNPLQKKPHGKRGLSEMSLGDSYVRQGA